jgi:hypothetical protein
MLKHAGDDNAAPANAEHRSCDATHSMGDGVAALSVGRGLRRHQGRAGEVQAVGWVESSEPTFAGSGGFRRLHPPYTDHGLRAWRRLECLGRSSYSSSSAGSSSSSSAASSSRRRRRGRASSSSAGGVGFDFAGLVVTAVAAGRSCTASTAVSSSWQSGHLTILPRTLSGAQCR